MTRTSAAIILLVFIPFQGLANARDFLGQPAVDPAYVEMLVQGALRSALGSGHDVEVERLAAINATISPLFNVLAKNGRGLLSVFSMRYTVQRYFSQRYGWVVKGFDPYSSIRGNRELDNSTIMHGNIPGFVESIIQKSAERGGFSLQDVMVAIATIETLIFNENMKGLEAVYSV